jgi:hypothetical protein
MEMEAVYEHVMRYQRALKIEAERNGFMLGRGPLSASVRCSLDKKNAEKDESRIKQMPLTIRRYPSLLIPRITDHSWGC